MKTTTTTTTMRFFVLLVATALAADGDNKVCGDKDGEGGEAAAYTCGDGFTAKTTNFATIDCTDACTDALCCDADETDDVGGAVDYTAACSNADDADKCKKSLEDAAKAASDAVDAVLKCTTDNASDVKKLAECLGAATYKSEKACKAGVEAWEAVDKDYAASDLGKAAAKACDTIAKSLDSNKDAKAAYDKAKAADESPAFMLSGAIALIALLL